MGALSVAPAQVVTGFGPGAIVTPAGSVSVTAKLLANVGVGLKKVNRRRDRVPGTITLGVNCFVIPRLVWVVRLVVACPALLRPSLVVIALMGMKLVTPPIVVEVTFAEKVQD